MTWRWLGVRGVLAVHAEQIADHGGVPGLRDRALLESALARPRNLAAYGEPSAFRLAAAYAFGIARNHPFVDGNERTALVAAATLLLLNGYELAAPEAEAVEVVLRLAAGSVDEGALAGSLERHSSRA